MPAHGNLAACEKQDIMVLEKIEYWNYNVLFLRGRGLPGFVSGILTDKFLIL